MADEVVEQGGTVPLPVKPFEKPRTGTDLTVGDDVFFRVKHLHGIHGRVMLTDPGTNLFIVRVMEEGFEGHLVAFSSAELVPADLLKMKESASTRLPWDYED